MRELQVCPPTKRTKRKPAEVVRRLEFRANGAELIAWVGPEKMVQGGRRGFTNSLYVYGLAIDSVRELYGGKPWLWHSYERTPDPVISSDRGLVVFEFDPDGENRSVYFDELVSTEDLRAFPSLPSCQHGMGG